MVTTENKVLAISGNDNGDSSGLFNHASEMVDDPIPSNQSSSGQDLNSGIVNQFGQLIGEYSWLDDELWLPKSEDDDAMELCNEGLNYDIVSSHKDIVDIVNIDQPSQYVDNSVSDGGLDLVKEKSSSLKDPSQNQSETSSPVSVLQRRRSYSNVRTAMCPQQPTDHNSLRGLQFLAAAISTIEQDQVVQSDSDYSMESSLSDETEEYVPSKQVRTKKISELLDFNNSDRAVKKCMHCETTETPQWRTGPMGRKTLCNACGVQFKHGRLFSNYRPLRSPTFNPSLHFNLPKKVQEMRMGYTSERDPHPTPKGPKPKKVKESRKENSECESDPNYTPKPKKIQKMRIRNSCERDTNLTPKLKKVEMRMAINIDLNHPITSESERGEEMALDNNDNLSLKPKSETKRGKEMILVNDSERDLNLAHRAKNFEETREKPSNLLESASHERNKNCVSNLIIEQKQATKGKKKCTHCESTETQQWREGPMGRHTLCNACGVQFRAGRLFPEYRPLKSPTYDPLLHSHLPKKVLEMRIREAEKSATSDICQDAV